MKVNVVGTYEDMDQAKLVADMLAEAGFQRSEIGIATDEDTERMIPSAVLVDVTVSSDAELNRVVTIMESQEALEITQTDLEHRDINKEKFDPKAEKVTHVEEAEEHARDEEI